MATAKILIFDSDPAAALVTKHGLQRLQPGTEVTTATSAGDAWLSCLHQAVDLLIIDPSPANSASSALIKALRTDRPDTEVCSGLKGRPRGSGESAKSWMTGIAANRRASWTP